MATQIKTQSRIHKVARLEIAGIKDDRIAAIVGLTPAGLSTLKQRQDYKDLVLSLHNQTIDRWDEELAGDVAALRARFAVGVPLAMSTLLEAVKQKKDLKASIEAAKELLDRDPQAAFAKNSRASQEDKTPSIPDTLLDNIAKHGDDVVSQINTPVATPKEAIN